mmetsp:Transcript_6578/g.19015  ORF Transcript_6578/g.19015 Transcript_6578/m.19015 type:complete len:246 (-) Transcript_6578:30-767(-)
MSVDGSVCPDACCAAACRARTAPSESRPASFTGASASTPVPVVDSSDFMIISSVTTRLSDAQPVAALREACPSSSGGTVGIRPRNLPHERTAKLITAGTPGSSAARNAVAPCSSPIRPMPDAALIRALTELLAAMPTPPTARTARSTPPGRPAADTRRASRGNRSPRRSWTARRRRSATRWTRSGRTHRAAPRRTQAASPRRRVPSERTPGGACSPSGRAATRRIGRRPRATQPRADPPRRNAPR